MQNKKTLLETVNMAYQAKGAWCQNVPTYRKEEWTLDGTTESVVTRFVYDAKGRRTAWDLYAGNTLRQPHSATCSATTGNISKIIGASTIDLAYGEYGRLPHAVTSATAASGSVPHAEQRITYTPFRKAKTIDKGGLHYGITYD